MTSCHIDGCEVQGTLCSVPTTNMHLHEIRSLACKCDYILFIFVCHVCSCQSSDRRVGVLQQGYIRGLLAGSYVFSR